MGFTHEEDNETLGSDMSASWVLPEAMLLRCSLSPFLCTGAGCYNTSTSMTN